LFFLEKGITFVFEKINKKFMEFIAEKAERWKN